ncbi:MAG: QacE family quaternary ammonium compound efflux SMR transporter [Alphaproteobacteria bacterium]|nr:QacE family quaternary ammonium compound efflux SMR transporter [Alphaproteobacteria bacterium]
MSAQALAWIWLAVAALFEVGWAISLKQATNGGGIPVWIATVAAMIASVVFLALATRELPIGTAYAAWTGAGTAGVVLAGVVLFGESADIIRIGCVVAILAGVIGLKLSGT